MKMNNKGITMIELLAVITLISILAVVSVGGVSRYRAQAQEQAYETMLKSTYEATRDYIMENNITVSGTITAKELVEKHYLEALIDKSTDEECDALVEYKKLAGRDSNKKLGKFEYTVTLKCTKNERGKNRKKTFS